METMPCEEGQTDQTAPVNDISDCNQINEFDMISKASVSQLAELMSHAIILHSQKLQSKGMPSFLLSFFIYFTDFQTQRCVRFLFTEFAPLIHKDAPPILPVHHLDIPPPSYLNTAWMPRPCPPTTLAGCFTPFFLYTS